MEHKVNVIVSYNTKGQIRPLWFELPLEDSEPMKILSYSLAYTDPSWGGYKTFICHIINRSGCEQEIRLRFYNKESYWTMLCSETI